MRQARTLLAALIAVTALAGCDGGSPAASRQSWQQQQQKKVAVAHRRGPEPGVVETCGQALVSWRLAVWIRCLAAHALIAPLSVCRISERAVARVQPVVAQALAKAALRAVTFPKQRGASRSRIGRTSPASGPGRHREGPSQDRSKMVTFVPAGCTPFLLSMARARLWRRPGSSWARYGGRRCRRRRPMPDQVRSAWRWAPRVAVSPYRRS